MSAFAISGLILAVIPICQEAIIKRASTMSDAREKPFQRELSKYIRWLRLHQDQLELSLRKLLNPICEPKDIDEMIQSPAGPRWKEVTLQQRLLERHGSIYKTFESEISHICDTMAKIAAMLGLGAPNMSAAGFSSLVQAANSSQSGLSYNYPQRLRLASDFDKIRELFQQLKRAQNNLDSLIQKNENRPTMPALSPKVPSGALQILRKRAMALYTVLSELYHCKEHSFHCANLRLEDRKLTEHDFTTGEQQHSHNRFKLVLSEPWRWQYSEALVHDATSKDPQILHLASQTKIEEGCSICPLVEQYGEDMPNLGFCIDGTTEGKLTGLYRAMNEQSRNQCMSDKVIDLGSLLASDPQMRPGMARGARMSLAVILVSSVCQLHTTHWLMETWSERDIVFLPKRGSSNEREVEAASPYLVHHFGTAIDAIKERQRTGETPEHKRAALLNLGIILTELWTGRRLKYERSQDDVTSWNTDKRSKDNALGDLLHSEGDELPKLVRQAVDMCRALDSQDEEKVASELWQMVEDMAAVSTLCN